MATPTLQRPQTAATLWKIDPNHSSISFAVKHMMFATVHGRFDDFSGTIRLDPDHVDRSGVDVTIQVASITTGIGARDTHLRSADFFDVEHHPVATFRGSGAKSHGTRFGIDGELTMRGISRPISLKAELQGTGVDPSGIEVAGFEATGTLNRKDFGLNWNQALESGGVLVGDDIRLTISVEATRIAS